MATGSSSILTPTTPEALLLIPPAGSPFPPPARLRSCVLRAAHFSDYRYASQVRTIVTQLRLVPRERHGWQRRVEEQVQVAPLPHSQRRFHDDLGNEVVEVRHERVERHLTIVVKSQIETVCAYTNDGMSLPLSLPLAQEERREEYLAFTRRTVPGDSLEIAARDFSREAPDPSQEPFAFALAVAAFIRGHMIFATGTTGIGTTAGEAWEARSGVCQDYSHIALSLCRLSGVPARYVSGYVPGEGVMHAWVEMLLTPPGSEPRWWAIDPTYNKWVNERYVTVAVGREYGDITPNSGTYFGGKNELHHRTIVSVVSQDNKPVP